jgi:hypothetical protein
MQPVHALQSRCDCGVSPGLLIALKQEGRHRALKWGLALALFTSRYCRYKVGQNPETHVRSQTRLMGYQHCCPFACPLAVHLSMITDNHVVMIHIQKLNMSNFGPTRAACNVDIVPLLNSRGGRVVCIGL